MRHFQNPSGFYFPRHPGQPEGLQSPAVSGETSGFVADSALPGFWSFHQAAEVQPPPAPPHHQHRTGLEQVLLVLMFLMPLQQRELVLGKAGCVLVWVGVGQRPQEASTCWAGSRALAVRCENPQVLCFHIPSLIFTPASTPL